MLVLDLLRGSGGSPLPAVPGESVPVAPSQAGGLLASGPRGGPRWEAGVAGVAGAPGTKPGAGAPALTGRLDFLRGFPDGFTVSPAACKAAILDLMLETWQEKGRTHGHHSDVPT